MTHPHTQFARRSRYATVLVVAAALSAGLTACSDSNKTTPAASAGSQTPSTQAPMAASVQAQDTWAKAAKTGMSAAFGTLKNTGTKPVTLTNVSGIHGEMQLHVTEKTTQGMQMKETKSFTIPAGGSLVLKPGGNHLMFMDLTSPLTAGDNDTVRITFQDGSQKSLPLAVRAYDGAKEKYSDASGGSSSASATHSDMSGMAGMSDASSGASAHTGNH